MKQNGHDIHILDHRLFWFGTTFSEDREHFIISLAKIGESEESGEEVTEGEMPPSDYLFLHSDAALNANERKAFEKGLAATFGRTEHVEDDHY